MVGMGRAVIESGLSALGSSSVRQLCGSSSTTTIRSCGGSSSTTTMQELWHAASDAR